jgi:hypothetical protein
MDYWNTGPQDLGPLRVPISQFLILLKQKLKGRKRTSGL